MHRTSTRFSIAALVAAAVVAAGGVALGARGNEDAVTPAWFQPIADYYGGNPKITPETDFAALQLPTPKALDELAILVEELERPSVER